MGVPASWFGGGLLPDDLTDEERRQLQMQAMMSGGAALLQGSGYSDVPITGGQGLGAALGAAQQAYSGGAETLSAKRERQRAAEAAAAKAAEESAYIAGLSPAEQMAARFPSLANIATKKYDRENPTAPKPDPDLETKTVGGREYYRSGDTWKLIPKDKPAGGGAGGGGAPKQSVVEKRADELEDFERLTGTQVSEADGREYLLTGKKPAVMGDGAGKDDPKAAAAKSMAVPISNIRGVLNDGLDTGGVLGSSGMLQQVFNKDKANFFENQVQQLSADLRQIFRIPGEGSLSDYEAKQYGVQLPSMSNSPEVNQQILDSLEARVAARNNAATGSGGGGPAGSAPPAPGTPAAPSRDEIEAELRRRGLM